MTGARDYSLNMENNKEAGMNVDAMATDLFHGNSYPESYTDDELVAIAGWAAHNDKTKFVLRVARAMKDRGMTNKYTRVVR
jgi:hypothetical protein